MKLVCNICGPIPYYVLDGQTVGGDVLKGIEFHVKHPHPNRPAVVEASGKLDLFQRLNHKKWLRKAREMSDRQIDHGICPNCRCELELPWGKEPEFFTHGIHSVKDLWDFLEWQD